MTEEELTAGNLVQQPKVSGAPVKIGLVGVGQWGREILSALSRIESADVRFLCDTYEPYLKKSLEIAPKAATVSDYRKLLDVSDVEAIIVSTPSHLHREIAIASLQAGKHVYCEAPLANSIEDARAIGIAAQQSKAKFQAGLQGRSNALFKHVSQFVKAGVLGSPILATSQWNKKQSWRRAGPTPERESELNWRLSRNTSSGLVGEVGVHQLDLMNWYLRALPVAVSGFGRIAVWNDGRNVPDTLQTFFEYESGVRTTFSSTLASSFSDSYTLFQGTESSLMMRDKRGWMVKEVDSPLLGWEVYAKKEPIHNETGICMVADATKLLEAGKEPGKDGPVEPTHDSLYLALQDFTRCIREGSRPTSGPIEGYQATVVAVKANEAVLSGSRLVYDKTIFELDKEGKLK
jgi:predicted dehydrogenase